MRESVDRSCDVVIAATCLLLLALALFAGCSPAVVVGASGDEHDHEAAHRVPGHFPGTATAAIVRLKSLLEASPSEGATTPDEHGPADEHEVTPRQEVYDLARWLPELAAETELDEPTWNEIRDASGVLERAAGEASGDAAPTGEEVAAAMRVLSRMPQAIQEAEVAYRRERGLDDPAELVIDAATEADPSTTGPES